MTDGSFPAFSDSLYPGGLQGRPVVLVVDDQPENLSLIGALLDQHYDVKVAPSGKRALHAMDALPRPHLVLLDINMPDMDGHEVLRRIRAEPRYRHIPVIFVTSDGAPIDEARGLQEGASDYLAKPISPPKLLARVAAHLELASARLASDRSNRWLQREVQRRVQDVELVQQASLLALASLGEVRDNETGQHLRRTQNYIEVLGKTASVEPRIRAGFDHTPLDFVVRAAPLHDIGKIGIPDHILNKPGSLNAREWDVMRTHADLGARALQRAIDEALSGDRVARADLPDLRYRPLAFLETARDVARHHHERWDGTGYPYKLKGEAIPQSARLMAVADVYDALSTKRVYKDALPQDEVVAILTAGRGTHFDPVLIDAFQDCSTEFRQILERYAEPEPLQAHASA